MMLKHCNLIMKKGGIIVSKMATAQVGFELRKPEVSLVSKGLG